MRLALVFILICGFIGFSSTPAFAQPCSFTQATFQAGGTFGETCTLNIGTSDLTINTTVNWTTGTLTIVGNDGDIVITGTGRLNINGGNIETIDNNDGDLTIRSGGRVDIAAGASFTSYEFISVSGQLNLAGTVTSTNSMIQVPSGGVVVITSTGSLTTLGTGDSNIAGTLTSAGSITTNGDINLTGNMAVTGGTVTIGQSLPDPTENSDLTVSGGGKLTIAAGATVTTEDDLIIGSGATSSGSVTVAGTMNVGDDLTVTNTTPNSQLLGLVGGSVRLTATQGSNGNFVDNECTYPSGFGTFDFCSCNGLHANSGGANLVCAASSPVVLTTFDAVQIDNVMKIEWTTASEIENHYFTLERLQTDDSFLEVVRVNGHGTTLEEHQYSAIDPRPLPGKNYYRLKQTDFGGPVTYFPLIIAEFTPRIPFVSVFPNPAQQHCIVEFGNLLPHEHKAILIRDLQGGTIATMETEADDLGKASFALSLDNFAPGLYFVSSGTLTTKVIVSDR